MNIKEHAADCLTQASGDMTNAARQLAKTLNLTPKIAADAIDAAYEEWSEANPEDFATDETRSNGPHQTTGA
jgi:hypothetical protein